MFGCMRMFRTSSRGYTLFLIFYLAPTYQQDMYIMLNIIIIIFLLAEIPENEYIKYFSPDYSLKIQSGHLVGKHFFEFPPKFY